MNKYPCGLVEDVIPLYVDGDVSDVTKEIVEEHVIECQSCRSLVNEYSNDDIKLTVTEEDLPSSTTFRTWVRRLKIWGVIAIVLLLISAITIGIVGYNIGKTEDKDILTLTSVVKTFKSQGLSLKKDTSKSVDEYDLKGVKPAIFSVGENKDTLLIYIFKSFVERDSILNETNKFKDSYSFEEKSFKAKNVLIVFIPKKLPETEIELEYYSKILGQISNIVFKDLNDGKELVFKGESENWEGTFTLKYYEHWWKDENGTTHYDNYSVKNSGIRFKNPDVDSVGLIDFEYKTSVSSGSATGLELDEDGYINTSSGGGNGAMTRKEDEIKFKIKWNGKEENIVLKAQ